MHSMRAKSSSASWTKVRRFLGECFEAPERVTARLDVRKPSDSSKMDAIVDRFESSFGSFISGSDAVTTCLNWFLDDDQLDEALSVIDSLPEPFVDELGRQRIHVMVKVQRPKLRDRGHGTLANQGGDHYANFEGEPDRILGENYLDAELGKNNYLYAFLSLPFAEPSAEFYEYAEFLRANFPCAMSKSAWKKWSLTKSGARYVGRKLKYNAAASAR